MYAVRMNSRLSRKRLHLVGVNRLNIGVAKKIRLIQGKHMGHTIALHYRGKTRIVCLRAASSIKFCT